MGAVLLGCQSDTRFPETPHETLAAYGFFEGPLADLTPADGVLPYDLNSPLFSDYAHKARFVWMPEGTSAKYSDEGVLDFPEGTVLIKNFYYNQRELAPEDGRRILETRLLIHRGEEWEAVGYIWNDEQTEARREVIGGIKQVSWQDGEGRDRSIDYIIPNKNQCKSCHVSGDQQIPIGPKAANLNKAFPYADGVMNQLQKWTDVGYLSGFEPAVAHESWVSWEDLNAPLDERALAYLEINCGHCHNETGSANTSGLHLMANAELGTALGIFKAPVSAGSGTGGRPYSIVPGHPEQSIMVYRMASDEPAAMMPELGRSLVHEEGVALIRDWIREMKPSESS